MIPCRKAIIAGILLFAVGPVFGETTIDPANAFAWGGNAGAFNWRPSLADGVLTGEYVCSGMVWAGNAGWINLGNGAPANGIRYQNAGGADFGVNLLADGSLRGLAWGANIGWVNFEETGNARIDFATGILSGFAWGVNVGWITLDDGGDHFVATTSIPSGADTDGDGITDAWELGHAGILTVLTLNGDADGDGFTDVAEYAADTDPLDGAAGLRITEFGASSDTTLITLAWTSRLSRRYYIESTSNLSSGLWDSPFDVISPDSDLTTRRDLLESAALRRFYRIRAVRPLAP